MLARGGGREVSERGNKIGPRFTIQELRFINIGDCVKKIIFPSESFLTSPLRILQASAL